MTRRLAAVGGCSDVFESAALGGALCLYALYRTGTKTRARSPAAKDEEDEGKGKGRWARSEG